MSSSPTTPRRLVTSLLVFTTLFTATLLSPSHVEARPMEGRLGLGGQVETGLLGSTLSVRYWVSDLGLQGLFGFDTKKSTETEAGYREFRVGLRLLYAITRTRLTNLVAGVGFATFIRDSVDSGENPVFLDAFLSPELHLGDHFAVSAQIKFSIEFGASPRRSLDHASFGAGFHYYFR